MNETKMDTENTQKFDHTIKSEFGNDVCKKKIEQMILLNLTRS